MRREYDFIQNLDAKDVGYVRDKKLEHAVLLVQRNWRRIKAAREYKKVRQGLAKEEHEYERTPEDLERIKQSGREYEKRKSTWENKRKDNFWEQIEDDRKRELKEKVIEEQKKKTNKEIEKLNHKKIADQFNVKYEKWNNGFLEFERNRHNANYQLTQNKIMESYLLEMTPEEHDLASEEPEFKRNREFFEEDK